MPKYIIEREIPGASQLGAEELQAIAQKSCNVLDGMANPKYHWLHSYVAGDKIYCVHIAPSEEAIREHAEKGGFPVTNIAEIAAQIDPVTAE